MLETFYPYIFITVLLSMLWLFYRIYQEKSTILPNISFAGASISYAFVVFMTDFSFYYKLLAMLPRDAVAFVVVFLLANNLKSTRGFFLTAIGVGVGGYLLYSNFIPEKFKLLSEPTKQEIQTNKLNTKGELLLDIKANTDLPALQALLKPFGVTFTKAFPEIQHNEYSELDDYYLVDIPTEALGKMNNILTTINASKLADWVEMNEIVGLSPIESRQSPPNDKPIDYGINDPNLDKMWAFDKMRVADYYQYIKKENIQPKKKAKIAILDTGVDSKHEDLQGNFTSTKKQYDSDKQSHGTHCAGIAASVSNNGLGVASLALNGQFVTVTSIKVLSDYGFGTQDDIIRGILEAADKGADVISMSLGGPSSDPAQKAYEEAIKYAQKSGAIVVVAAGNSNENANKHVPANCKGVIVVSAVNSKMERASFSNFVSDMQMGIAAPGEDILSTIPKNKYAAYSGTSMATPYVAGLLGILKSIDPKLTTEKAYNILKNTGFETKATEQTGKMINPLKAVKQARNN